MDSLDPHEKGFWSPRQNPVLTVLFLTEESFAYLLRCKSHCVQYDLKPGMHCSHVFLIVVSLPSTYWSSSEICWQPGAFRPFFGICRSSMVGIQMHVRGCMSQLNYGFTGNTLTTSSVIWQSPSCGDNWNKEIELDTLSISDKADL